MRRLGSLLVTLALGGCSVDARHLELARDAGTSGTGGGGGHAAGPGNGGESNEGGAGAVPSPDGLVNGCADLDTDGVADCETTLVDNPSFTSDVESWTRLGDASLTWDRKNALPDRPSGSARLADDSPYASAPTASAFQCVEVRGEKLVIAYANAFVEPSGDAGDPARAGLEVSFFEGRACSGVSDGFFETPPSDVEGEWTMIQAGGLSKETTKSASIELVGIKAESAASLTVYFDNVMLKAQSL